MAERQRELEAVLDRCDRGAISPAIALMEMLVATGDERKVEAALEALTERSPTVPSIVALLRENRAGCARIAAMVESGVDSPPRNASVEEGVAFCRRLFDWSVGQSEEASVALYSLGNPALLEAATREIVALFDSWGSVEGSKRALDLGCGIGRMEQALSSKLDEIHAIDVSTQMVAAARRRCAGLSNVVVSTSSGLDLRDFTDASFDLVFAVDSFPYIVQAGMPLVATYFAECARVLRAAGEFIILNFSYEADLPTDRSVIASLAQLHGFELLVNGGTPFTLWDGAAFRLRLARR